MRILSTFSVLTFLENMSEKRERKKKKRTIKECVRPIEESAEIEYAIFYSDFLKKLFDFENTQLVNRFKESLNTSARLKCSEKGLIKTAVSLTQYYTKESRCAYLYRYSVLHSKMVSFHFTNFLIQHQAIATKWLKKDTLKICCLGGGPAVEVVAIIKVLNDLMVNMASISITDIHVTIVDKCSAWKGESLAILEALKENASLGISKDINISAEFIQANLLKEIASGILERIKQADIVTMVKFVSELQRLLPENTSIRIREMIENVANNMNDKGCFFMVDNGGGGIPTEFRSVFNGNLKWRKMYHLASHKDHVLQQHTLRIFDDLLPGCGCSKETKVYSCTWMRKKRTELSREVQKSVDLNYNSQEIEIT